MRHKKGVSMIKVILALVLMQSTIIQADVKHQIRFCAGKFCGGVLPLTISQELEINQQFAEGNLINMPIQSKEITFQKADLRSTNKQIEVELANSLIVQNNEHGS
jgi:hypothetical protein